MPTIDVYPDVPRAYNRVEVNWADVPSVTHARVLRVDVDSGTCTPLRPHICFDGDYLLLSCGHGIFWDTEVPLDRSVYYITEGVDAPCIPASASVFDTFTRTEAGIWGVSTSGHTWSQIIDAGNVPSVSGGTGNGLLDTANDSIYEYIESPGPSVRAEVQFRTPVIAVGGLLNFEMIPRFIDVNNYIGLQVLLLTDGTIDIRFVRRLGGVGALIGPTINLGTYLANEFINVIVEAEGTDFRAKAWRSTVAMPPNWITEITNNEFPTAPFAAIRLNPAVGNLNVPVTLSVDNLFLTDLCEPCIPVTAESEPSMMPSNGAFRLKDPVRPCNDIYMPLCFDQSNQARHRDTGQYCPPGGGVFFASMETETYDSNSLTVNPTNARRPIALTRQRRDVSSSLTVVSRTFNDRDALLRLAAPGSPILLQGPPQYGIPDRYMDVGTVAVDRGLTDHRFQVRIVQMPHVAVNRPAGPQQGVCGSRVDDYCDFTWQDLADSGSTWEDLVRGRPNGATAGFRTWDDVLAEFADWDDVNSGVRTWYDLEVGD